MDKSGIVWSANTPIENASRERAFVARIVHANVAPGRICAMYPPSGDLIVGGQPGVSMIGKQTLDLHPYYGPVVHDQPILAIDRVRYRGEPIAVIADPGERVFLRADREPIVFEIETEPPTSVATGAKKGDPPLVHVIDLLERGPLSEEISLEVARTNRLARLEIPGAAPAAAAFTQRSITIAEPLRESDGEVFVSARWQNDAVTVHSRCADPDEVRRELSAITGRPEAEIRIVAPESARGGDTPPPVPGAIGAEAIAVAIARRARRPVDLVGTRSDFGWVGPRATIGWDEHGNALLTIDAGAVAGYLPLWLDDFARLVAERTAAGANVTANLDYSEQPPIAASKSDWIVALTEALETSTR